MKITVSRFTTLFSAALLLTTILLVVKFSIVALASPNTSNESSGQTRTPHKSGGKSNALAAREELFAQGRAQQLEIANREGRISDLEAGFMNLLKQKF